VYTCTEIEKLDQDEKGWWFKENGGGVNLSMIYLIYCKNFGNATMYPHPE
jgi:hypothetical protein